MSSFIQEISDEVMDQIFGTGYMASMQQNHPWLSDLTSLALMLEGKLQLPHGKEVNTTSMRFGQMVINNVAVQPFFDSNCHECIKAYDRQQEYKSQKLLLEEM